jgi:hypothetical protein
MKIGVIGAGISGLGAAFALKDRHEVTLFEKDARLGGHANPVRIDYDGASIDIDTGFIVYNTRNYPNLIGLFDHLGVESVATDMSFAFAGRGLEWSSNFPGGVFAQKRNLLNPGFLGMLSDIRRFNSQALADLEAGALCDLTLGGYLRLRGYGPAFERNYLLPMGAAIWSTNEPRLSRSAVRATATSGSRGAGRDTGQPQPGGRNRPFIGRPPGRVRSGDLRLPFRPGPQPPERRRSGRARLPGRCSLRAEPGLSPSGQGFDASAPCGLGRVELYLSGGGFSGSGDLLDEPATAHRSVPAAVHQP